MLDRVLGQHAKNRYFSCDLHQYKRQTHFKERYRGFATTLPDVKYCRDGIHAQNGLCKDRGGLLKLQE